MKTKRRKQYEWARGRVRDYKDEYLNQKSSQGGFYLEWERYLQDKLETDAVLKRILAQFAGVTIARDVWREEDRVNRRAVAETPPAEEAEDQTTDTLDEDGSEDETEDEVVEAAGSDGQHVFKFLIDGQKVEPTITFADATAPGGMRKVHNSVCTVGQFILSADLAVKNGREATEAAVIKRTMGRIALSRAGGNRSMLLSDPRVRDPSLPPPQQPPPDHPEPRPK